MPGLFFFLVLSALALARHQAFATGRHDLEIYSQVTWGLANGAPFETTLLRTNMIHLAEHLALVLLPVAPLYGLISDPRLLLLIQESFLALLVLTVGCFAVKRLGSRSGLMVASALALSPPLAAIALDDFHAVVLAALPIALGMVLALDGRVRSASLLLLLAGLLEEEAWLAVAGLGLLLLARRRGDKSGFGLVALGLAMVALAAFVIMPSFHHPDTLRDAAPSRSVGHFSMIREDLATLGERVAGSRGRDAVLALVLPTGGLALLSPGTVVAGLPTFAALFLQDRDDTFLRHWAAPILPAVWLAAISALAWLPVDRRALGVAALGVGTTASYLISSPLPGGAAFQAAEFLQERRTEALARAVALVPPDVPVAASANLAAHLANRRQVYAYPIDEQYLSDLKYEEVAPEAYLLDLTDAATQRVRPLSKSSPLTADPPFVVQSTSQKIMVLTREAPPPQHALDFRFGRRMVLVGYDLARSGTELRLTLHWWGDGTFSGDFRRVVELLDVRGQVLSDDPSLELTITFPTQKWLSGQRVLDEIDFNLPGGAAAADRVRVQWQNRERRTPLPLPDGAPAAEFPL